MVLNNSRSPFTASLFCSPSAVHGLVWFRFCFCFLSVALFVSVDADCVATAEPGMTVGDEWVLMFRMSPQTSHVRVFKKVDKTYTLYHTQTQHTHTHTHTYRFLLYSTSLWYSITHFLPSWRLSSAPSLRYTTWSGSDSASAFCSWPSSSQ